MSICSSKSWFVFRGDYFVRLKKMLLKMWKATIDKMHFFSAMICWIFYYQSGEKTGGTPKKYSQMENV